MPTSSREDFVNGLIWSCAVIFQVRAFDQTVQILHGENLTSCGFEHPFHIRPANTKTTTGNTRNNLVFWTIFTTTS